MKTRYIILSLLLTAAVTANAQKLVVVKTDGVTTEYRLADRPYMLFADGQITIGSAGNTSTMNYQDFNRFAYLGPEGTTMAMVVRQKNDDSETDNISYYTLDRQTDISMAAPEKIIIADADDINYDADDTGKYIYNQNMNDTIYELGPSSPYYGQVPVNSFIDVNPTHITANPFIAFNIPSIGSGTYDMYLITMPVAIAPNIDENDAQKGYQFRFNIFYRRADGTFSSSGRDILTNPADGSYNFTSDPLKPDTIFLGTRTFGDIGYNPSMILQVASYVSQKQTRTYSRHMCLNSIILKAHDEDFTTAMQLIMPDLSSVWTSTQPRIDCFEQFRYNHDVLSDNIMNPRLHVTPDFTESNGLAIALDNPDITEGITITPDAEGNVRFPFLLFPGYDYTYTAIGPVPTDKATIRVSDNTDELLSINAHDENGLSIAFDMHVKGMDTFWQNNIKDNRINYQVYTTINAYKVGIELTDMQTGETTRYDTYQSFSLSSSNTSSGVTDDMEFNYKLDYPSLKYGHTYSARAMLIRNWSIYESDKDNIQYCKSSTAVTFTTLTESQYTENLNNSLLPNIIAKDPKISIFSEALFQTRFNELLMKYEDKSYHCSADSVEQGRCYNIAVEYDNVFYMGRRFYGFTGFIEPDEVLAEHGIYSLDDLRAYAKQIYDDMYPEDAGVTDETDRRNSLNRWVSYHFLPARMHYNELTVDNIMLKNCFDRRHWDVADWYETMMPYSIMKISFPSGTQAGRYVNRRGVQSSKDPRGVFIAGAKILSPSEAGVNQEAVNGVYHYITDVIDYGRNTQDAVLNERMRIDATTLSPDFLTSGARGHKVGQFGVGGIGGCPDYPYEYGVAERTADPKKNSSTCLGFKAGSAENFQFDDNYTHLHVRNRNLSFWSYQGDEVAICGQFDVRVKLPPMPEGEYELRIMTCLGFNSRGVIQYFIDDKPAGLPWDLRQTGTSNNIGWIADSEFNGDDEAILEFDRQLHNNGWMKGPASYHSTDQTGNVQSNSFRDNNLTLRHVVGTIRSDGKTDHYLRIKQLLNSSYCAYPLDFIELCPRTVYGNEYYPEDIY